MRAFGYGLSDYTKLVKLADTTFVASVMVVAQLE